MDFTQIVGMCPKCRMSNALCHCNRRTTEEKYQEQLIVKGKETVTHINNGGPTDYYNIPNDISEIQDLIEYKEMNFAQGNILKAIYRQGGHSSYERDLNKIIFFAQRELQRITQ